MYKVIETFEYYVENPNDFCPVQEIVDKEKDLGVDAYWYNIENAPSHKYGDSPWGKSELSSVNLSNDKAFIDKKVLLMLIQNSEKLEAEGVDNWEGYSLAMKELNTGYQKDAITDEVLIKQYCE